MNTRIGKLELENGYPARASVEKLYDEMDFQRATQAYVWALPAVGFHGLHLAHRLSKDVKAAGYFVKHSPSFQLWFATRGAQPGPDGSRGNAQGAPALLVGPAEQSTHNQIRPRRRQDLASNQPPTLDYWRYLSEVLQPEPTEPRDRFFFAMLRPLGIEKGEPFKPDNRQKKILTDAAQVGEIMARSIAYEKRYPGATVWPGKRWEYANLVDLCQRLL